MFFNWDGQVLLLLILYFNFIKKAIYDLIYLTIVTSPKIIRKICCLICFLSIGGVKKILLETRLILRFTKDKSLNSLQGHCNYYELHSPSLPFLLLFDKFIFFYFSLSLFICFLFIYFILLLQAHPSTFLKNLVQHLATLEQFIVSLYE